MWLTEVEPEQLQVGNGWNAGRSVGQVGPRLTVEVVHGDAEDLTERQRHDGQVVARHAQCGRADEQAQAGRDQARDQHHHDERRLPVDGGERRLAQGGSGEGAGTEKRDVAQVEQAGQTDHDVEPDCGGGEHQHLGGDRHVGVRAVLGEREHEGHQERREHQHGAVFLAGL